jgi:multidrug efflux pump subunit AcrB
MQYDLEAIKNINLKTTPSLRSIKLSDVAKVEYRLPKRTNRSFTMGEESVSFNIFKHFSADSISLKETLENKLKQINKKAPDGVKIISVEDGPAFIERQINALKSNALFGIFLVIVTLYLFLGFRNAVMTSFGLPLAYLFTFIVLENLNISIDLISVVGMMLVIGIIVDDAIIISEQYMQNLEAGEEPGAAALNAVLSTWKPICGTIATTLIAFGPLLVGKDSMSSILFAIPVVVFTALGISLLESFFILPNHLKHFVTKPKEHDDTKVFQRFKRSYEKLLRFSLRFRYVVLASFVVMMGVSVYFAMNNINFNFNLNISSESVKFIGELKESNSVEESKEKIKAIEEVIAKIPKDRYKLYEIAIGRNYTNGKRMEGPQYFNFWISFSQLDENVEANKKFVNDFLQKNLEPLKKTGLYERLEVKIHKGGRDENRENIVEMTISSMSPFNIDKVTQKVKSIIEEKNIKGIKSVDLDSSLFKDAWVFKPDSSKIQASGLSINDVSSQLVLYIRNHEVYEHNVGNRTIKLYSYVEDGDNLTLDELSSLPIYMANGQKLPIGQFGTWVKQKREGLINHSNLMRQVVIDLPFNKEIIKKRRTYR